MSNKRSEIQLTRLLLRIDELEARLLPANSKIEHPLPVRVHPATFTDRLHKRK
jgi:hypothetical protein